MRPPTRVPRPRDYLNLLLNCWVVVLCATALSVGAGWVAWRTADPEYQSTAGMFIVTPGGATPQDAYYGNLNSSTRITTFQQLAVSSLVTTRVIDKLSLRKTPDELAEDITVIGIPPAVLAISVVGDDPKLTVEIANAVTGAMVDLSRELAAVDTSAPELALVDQAGPAIRRGSLRQNLLVGGGIGFALSAVLVVGYGLIRNRIDGREQAAHILAEETAGADQ
jgi:capsular polysaccharide biosynthesis protein